MPVRGDLLRRPSAAVPPIVVRAAAVGCEEGRSGRDPPQQVSRIRSVGFWHHGRRGRLCPDRSVGSPGTSRIPHPRRRHRSSRDRTPSRIKDRRRERRQRVTPRRDRVGLGIGRTSPTRMGRNDINGGQHQRADGTRPLLHPLHIRVHRDAEGHHAYSPQRPFVGERECRRLRNRLRRHHLELRTAALRPLHTRPVRGPEGQGPRL